jgi:hypothetical protein
MKKRDIKILDDLMLRTENLPEILHLRAAPPGYQFTDDDKALILDTYLKLDDILKEVAAFINIKFPGAERHVRAWNNIDFDTKIGPIKIVTTDREHIKQEWKKGMFDLKSLIKILKNESLLLIDDDHDSNISGTTLKEFSSAYTLDHYTDKKVIPNQELVNDTINYFMNGKGAGSFEPIDFLNLLDKQNEFLKLNFQNGELVIQHLKDLSLSVRQKHTLYGFILKWFGGYPVNNLNEDFDKTLKLVQREFLSFEGDTPEKQFCRADQATRNKFEKYGIAFTTAINHNIDVGEILAAMEVDEPKKTVYQNFNSLFADMVSKGKIARFDNRKAFLIAQSAYNYEFNVWLQTHQEWEYRNEEQYETFLTPGVFEQFLKYKNHGEPVPYSEPVSAISKLTLRQIALICHYTGRPVTRDTGKAIAKEYSHTSGDALFNHYTFYRSKANRTGAEDSLKKNTNKIELFEGVLNLLDGNETAKKQVSSDLSALKTAIGNS